jgi:hypothetical protein
MTQMNEKDEVKKDDQDVEVVYLDGKRTVFETFTAIGFSFDLILVGFLIGFFTTPYIRKNAFVNPPVIQEYKEETSSDKVKPSVIQKTPKIFELNRERVHKPGDIEYLDKQKAYVLYDETGFSVVYTLEDKKYTGVQLKPFVQEMETEECNEDVH